VTVEEWGIVIGAIVAAVLALGPWMFMVHGKLAAMTTEITGVKERLEWLCDRDEQRPCEKHTAQMTDLNRRVENLERQVFDG
jgi:hypothetical protein